jgi:arsenate reductase-like glutaredoxin family protein
MGCKKAQGFLEQANKQIGSITDANKEKRGRVEALALAKSMAKVIVGRSKKVVTIDMKNDPPDDNELAGFLLGPTGNLKAPTLRIGDTLLVGFSAEAYKQVLES